MRKRSDNIQESIEKNTHKMRLEKTKPSNNLLTIATYLVQDIYPQKTLKQTTSTELSQFQHSDIQLANLGVSLCILLFLCFRI